MPRLYNRIYGLILAGVKAANGPKGWLLRKAIADKIKNNYNGNGLNH